jgi:hypothetical protein
MRAGVGPRFSKLANAGKERPDRRLGGRAPHALNCTPHVGSCVTQARRLCRPVFGQGSQVDAVLRIEGGMTDLVRFVVVTVAEGGRSTDLAASCPSLRRCSSARARLSSQCGMCSLGSRMVWSRPDIGKYVLAILGCRDDKLC